MVNTSAVSLQPEHEESGSKMYVLLGIKVTTASSFVQLRGLLVLISLQWRLWVSDIQNERVDHILGCYNV